MFISGFPDKKRYYKKPKKEKLKRLSIFSYTPSFTSVAFGIKGKASKDITGLEIRPIKIL